MHLKYFPQFYFKGLTAWCRRPVRLKHPLRHKETLSTPLEIPTRQRLITNVLYESFMFWNCGISISFATTSYYCYYYYYHDG